MPPQVTIDPKSVQPLSSNLTIDPASIQPLSDHGREVSPSFRDELDQVATPEPIRSSSGIGGMAKLALNDLGAGIVSMASPLWHPEKFAQSMQPQNAWEYLSGPGAVAIDRMAAPMMKRKGENWSDYGGRIAGQGISMIPQFALAKAMPESMSEAQPSVVPAAETHAEKLMQAILPQEGLTPSNVRAAMREAPAVREYAQRTGNSLRTIPEGLKAAEGVAGEGLSHYKAHFLDPYATNQVHLPNNISPSLGSTSTIGEIDKRISDINDLIRPAGKARSAGAEMTAMEKLGLENEARVLRQRLYDELSQRTGVAPEDIRGLREGYGGQYAIKNALESGHYSRLTRTGMESQGAGPGIYPSKAGLIEKGITALRGGPERIANRQFASRMAKFEPRAPNYPVPRAQFDLPPAEPKLSPAMQRQLSVKGTDEGVQPSMTEPPRSLNGPMRKAPLVEESERNARIIRAERNNAAAQAEREAAEASRRKSMANQMTRGKRLDILSAQKGLK